jgi:hypothetical protein
VFKFRGCLDLCTLQFLIPLYCISYHIKDNVSFKFGSVDKHSVCIYLFLSVYKIFYFCLLLCYCLGTTYIVTVDYMPLVCLTYLNIAYH